MGVKLIGTGRSAPENVFTVKQMSEIVGTDISEFMAVLGIENRRQTGPGETGATLGIEAGRQALDDAGLKPEDIDLLILSTDTPDIISPQTSAIVAEGLGMRDGAPFFDMNASCTGFIFSSETAKNWLMGNKSIRNIMVVSVYNMTKFAPMQKGKFYCVFSDGAGAAIYTRDDSSEGYVNSHFIGHGSQWPTLGVYVGGTRFPATVDMVEGKGEVQPGLTFWRGELMNRNPELWPVIIREMLKKTTYSLDDISKFIFTQINKSAIALTCSNLGISMDRTHNIMDRYGYTGNACIIMALDDARKSGVIKEGDLVCLTASGVGYTMGTMLIRM